MKVHVILNSHLDPCWGWRRSQGVDEVIATARTACNMLDRYPEIKITRGEAWFYETVEKCAPELFRRIARHIESGRWCVVGGFYIQPDCNFPSPETLLRHGEIAQRYFMDRFGLRAKTGFNVDSFGHMATLPDFYTASGITNYVMQRPESAVLTLPGNPFCWKSARGASLKVFRLARSYATLGTDIKANVRANIEAALAETSDSVGQTMCFIGVGDHGGGPVPEEIEYLLDNPELCPGAELEFSTPDRFFEAIGSKELPVYRGELQYHAIGCYSAVSRIKRELRSAEILLDESERMQKLRPEFVDAVSQAQRDEIWKKVLFATFHDILPGTCIRSVYDDIYDDLGGVRSQARELIETAIRRQNRKIAVTSDQQIVFDNLSNLDYYGYFECEPWLGYVWADPELRQAAYSFCDENGQPVKVQEIGNEAALPMKRFALELNVPSGERKIVSVHRVESLPVTAYPTCPDKDFHGVTYACVSYDDTSDTWSHGIPGYPTSGGCRFELKKSRHGECGAIYRETLDEFAAPAGSLRVRTRRFPAEDMRELHMRLFWSGERKLVKLEFKLPFLPIVRRDGIPGGILERQLDGREYPIRDFVSLQDASGRTFTLVGDLTSADVQPDGTLRVTLLRTPIYLHHDPVAVPADHLYPVTDLGEHEYRFRMLFSETFDSERIAIEQNVLRQGLWFSEVTPSGKSVK